MCERKENVTEGGKEDRDRDSESVSANSVRSGEGGGTDPYLRSACWTTEDQMRGPQLS